MGSSVLRMRRETHPTDTRTSTTLPSKLETLSPVSRDLTPSGTRLVFTQCPMLHALGYRVTGRSRRSVPVAPIAPIGYAGITAPIDAAAYAAGPAAPSREAVLTTIKLNPGHAVFYRVD